MQSMQGGFIKPEARGEVSDMTGVSTLINQPVCPPPWNSAEATSKVDETRQQPYRAESVSQAPSLKNRVDSNNMSAARAGHDTANSGDVFPVCKSESSNISALEDIYRQNIETLRKLQALQTAAEKDGIFAPEINSSSISMIQEGLVGLSRLLVDERKNLKPNSYLRSVSTPSAESASGSTPSTQASNASLCVRKPAPLAESVSHPGIVPGGPGYF